MDEHWTDEQRARADAPARDESEPAGGDPVKEAGGDGMPAPPENAETAGAGDTPADEAGDALPTVTVNGAERALTPQEIAPLIESGARWEAFRDSYDKLQYLAGLANKDVPALIDALMESGERSQLDRRERVQQRLAEEYMELAREFPGKFRAFGDVPRSVVEAAVNQGISLYDAYLRHERSEEKRAADAKERQAQAAGQSSGSLKSDPVSTAPEIEAFLQGFSRSLR